MSTKVPDWLLNVKPISKDKDSLNIITDKSLHNELKSSEIDEKYDHRSIELSKKEKKKILNNRMNDDNNMKFMCMIIDKTVDEGEEFLKYAYPSTTPIAVHFIEMRMTFAALDNIMYSINGQSMEKSQFIKEKQEKQEKNNNEFYNEIPDSFSAVSIKLTGQLKGWNFILITWDNDIIANNVYIIALRLLQLISMTNGPLRKYGLKYQVINHHQIQIIIIYQL